MTKMPVPDLNGERASLRRARPEDIAARRKLGNVALKARRPPLPADIAVRR